jgi:SAM-dependent methyltransferase
MPGNEAFYRAISGSEYYVEGKWEFEQAIGDLRCCRARRVLDVGCGSGNFLRLLRRADPGLQIWGHDQSAVLMRQLAAEGFEALPGTPEQLAAGGFDRFDAICMFQVLEHAADPLAFLTAYTRLLQPGGLLIVTTPDADGPIRNFPEALTELPPHHLTQWTERAFRSCLPRFGLDITAVRNEPLPDYLWESYLPVQWERGIWPAAVFDPAARRQGRQSVSERMEFAVKGLRAVGVKRLHGVPSHTIYVRARLVDRNALASR